MPEEIPAAAPTPPTQGMQIGVVTSEEPGPDGRMWCKTEVRVGLTAFAFVVPPDMADNFADQLPERWRESAQRARLASSGFVVASNGHVGG